MKKHLLLSFSILFLGLSTSFAQQKVKEGSVNGGNLPSKDAILELESNTKGFLHTRISLVRTIDSAPLSAHTAGMISINGIFVQTLQ